MLEFFIMVKKINLKEGYMLYFGLWECMIYINLNNWNFCILYFYFYEIVIIFLSVNKIFFKVGGLNLDFLFEYII